MRVVKLLDTMLKKAALYLFVTTTYLIAPMPAPRPSVQVHISPAQTHQTIEGFGSCIIDFTNPPAFYADSTMYDRVVDDLGLTMLRMSIPQELEAINDDDDPNHFEWKNFNMHFMERRMRFAQALKKRGVTRFIAATWSPPEFTKTHHATVQGGHLRADMYAEYAENMAAFIIAAKQNWGIDIGSISIQNELLFIEPYKSCIYNPQQVREAVRALMRKFRREGITTQIHLPEDMLFPGRMLNSILPTMADPETRTFPGHFATHRQEEFAGVRKWHEATKQYNRQTWMTETSGHDQTWPGALKMANDMHDYLVGGNMSAWLYWQIAEPHSVFALMDSTRTSPKYFAAKQFYRYVRPGAVRVGSKSTNPDVLASAFRHATNGTLTMVLINRSDTEQTAQLTIDGQHNPTIYQVFRSTETEGCKPVGMFALSQPTLTLPPQSIVTLVGQGKPDASARKSEWPEAWKSVSATQIGTFAPPDLGDGFGISVVSERYNMPALRAEIGKGNLNKTLANGWTALHSALLGGNYEAVEVLLAAGADVNRPANDGWTPLHMAAGTFVGRAEHDDSKGGARTKYDLFRLIMAQKPDVNARTHDGWTPLHAAVANAHTAWRQAESQSLDRIRDLVRAGSNLEAIDQNGRTPLHWAAWQGYSRFTDALNVSDAVVQALIDEKANLNAVDNTGRTPLHYAAEMGYNSIVAALVQAGAGKTIRDKAGKTPAQLAENRQLRGTVAVLQTGQVAVSARQRQPVSASTGKLGKELLQAAWTGNEQTVQSLLEQGADLDYRDSDGFRAIDRARDNGHRAIVTLLQKAEKAKK
ncbi:ankyrin repeat domain-containing protein [Fibrella aquatilis]|uniref:Ankyrin repeat domain-containing protein n=1 Tax=Fibrella aquatilis TaxID=2817059 RepID=A0A939GAV9_9BACT|nr:ankyrin repeat domain-containing protein [Fibrella aquatilis]MBO0933869.1 ankyrin repeat domain-containing protein [Fibrella aquatilis]